VIGARPSNGKSAFAIQLAVDLAMQNKTVLFLSLEMENMECLERILTNMNKISNMTLRTNGGMKYEQNIKNSCDKLLGKRLFFSDCLGKSWEEIDSIVETKGVEFDAIFIDYIQNTKQTARTQKEGYDEFIRHLREMAIRKNFAAIILSQINRTSQEAKDKRPYLHQLKGTGFLEEHADICVLLHWPHKYDVDEDINYFEIHLAKNKLGATGSMRVRYYPQYNFFTEDNYVQPREPDVSSRIIGERCEEDNLHQTAVQRQDSERPLKPEDIDWQE
jgi:replicative DNA helicase